MFILSKIVGWLVTPETIMLIFIIIAIALMMLSKPKLSMAFLMLSVLWIATVFYSPVSTMLIRPLEERFTIQNVPEDITGIIVLSGGLETEISSSRGTVEFAIAADRLVQAEILASRHPGAKIIYSGGSSNIVMEGNAAADIALRYLLTAGISKDRIILEKEARNTFENVKFTKALIKPQKSEKYLLITSAFHMPRSVGLFQAQDWDVIPYPVDYRTSKSSGIGDPSRSALDNYINMRTALKEWVGLISYYFLGRTNAVLPPL